MRLEEEGGARCPAGDMAGGVTARLLARLLARESDGASEPAEGLDGVEAREAAAEAGSGGRAAEYLMLAARGTSGAATWMCTGAPRAWAGLLGEAGAGEGPEGTDTM